MKTDLEAIVFLIPSLDPDNKLLEFVNGLISNGVKKIIIINDGSGVSANTIFDELKNHKEVKILKHFVNQGKGRGLKTGFNYIMNEMIDIRGVVTADADGQHSINDTINCSYKLLETNEIIFGTRCFIDKNVPIKSKVGNRITSLVFKLLYGRWINDTQTGLRGLPIDFIPTCLSIEGERFEYEIAMLIKMVEDQRKIHELPIETIYYQSNRATHFDAIKDSINIYKIIFSKFFKFAKSSLFSAAVDLGFFSIMIRFLFEENTTPNAIYFSTIISRIVSSLLNYQLNKNSVFGLKGRITESIIKYYVLAVAQMLLSGFLVASIYRLIPINSTYIKIIVDGLLFIFSYKIQERYVFKE